jgi:hypothetical protein
MYGVGLIVLVVVGLGLAFLAVEASGKPQLRKHGPWLIAAVACIVATVVISTYDTSVARWLRPWRRGQLQELLATAGVLALLLIEAALISRWTRTKFARKPAYLGVFTCATLFAWLLTFLALWDVVPSS